MGRYVISDKAAADLTEIWTGHIRRGGTAENANLLIDGLLASFANLGDFPDIGTSRDYLPKDALALPHNKTHMIFYEKIVEGVEIVQVLPSDIDFYTFFADK